MSGVPENLIEEMRRLYRGLEMSAGIMRDPARTGRWAGAEKTAAAFSRYAATAQSLHALLVASAAANPTPAPDKLDAATIERCAQTVESLTRKVPYDYNPHPCYMTMRQAATAIRALATDPQQHGGKGA